MLYIKQENTDWGIVRHYNDNEYRFALYSYNDDPNTMYLANVKVKQSSRGKNIGNMILKFAEEESKKYGFNAIVLVVFKKSWVYDWYARHGYENYSDNGQYMWMRKSIEQGMNALYANSPGVDKLVNKNYINYDISNIL